MSVFDYYAYYYDLLYKDKNYKEEVDYILGLINNNAPEATSILDLGCGTGKHDLLFAESGFKVVGIDFAQKMVDAANKNKPLKNGFPLEFLQGDIRTINLGKKFDVVTSLFHVVNYQISNKDLTDTFEVAKKHLNAGGIFIFDSWYGPGVLSDKPELRVKKIEDERISVVRIAEPEIHYRENVVDVNYWLLIKDKELDTLEEIREQHRMRYLFYPEVEIMAKSQGFEIIAFHKWLTHHAPQTDWYVTFVFKNID